MNRLGLFDYQKKIEEIRVNFEFDFVALALIQPENENFEIKWEYASGNRSNRIKTIKLQSNKGIAGVVFKTGKSIFIENTKEIIDEYGLYNYPIVVAEKLSCLGALPLFKYHRVIGLLLVGNRAGNKMREDDFSQFTEHIGPRLGPFYFKEMLHN